MRLRQVPGRVFFAMRTIVFFDGQNLYHLARLAWATESAHAATAYTWPSYDAEKLALALATRESGRELSETRFYTGVPSVRAGNSARRWHDFWTNKLRNLRNRGVYVYRGGVNASGQEKGVDVSLAIDLIRATYEQRFEVAIIVSQDSDFGPAVALSKQIAQNQGRQLVFESAFPFGPNISPRGVPGTTWIHIDKATYDACLDPTDYRRRS